ncbi:putative nuclease HARBI1 [Sitophilus oryzae]|uniref:Nuclease HARBI1 n=1 Tax=Sitophilus oryzae TaxID=7048 RepID=A0A6J2X3X6_SITOR|nr:putative nuclease HARBI1 [Sitophilus oryzae]
MNQPQILNNWIHFPRNIEEMQALRTSFFQKYQFPGVIGCVDCTHISIVAPHTDDPEFPEYIYVNRKNYHSINVQLICDSNLKIMNVNAQFPGSTHDANIWRHSQISTLMENIYRRDPQNVFFLLGDSGYPTRPWLLTPIQNPTAGPEERFNDRLCSIRATIERCNGVLKNRFRCLLKHRVLHYSPTVAGQIINSCCVLHNMCIANNVPEPPAEQENEDIDYGIYAVENVPAENIGRVNPDLAAARVLQQNIIDNHFRQ